MHIVWNLNFVQFLEISDLCFWWVNYFSCTVLRYLAEFTSEQDKSSGVARTYRPIFLPPGKENQLMKHPTNISECSYSNRKSR